MFRCFRGLNAACLVPVSSVKFVIGLFYFMRVKKMQLQAPLVVLYMVVKEPGNVRYDSRGVLDTPDGIPPVKLLRLFVI